MSLSKVFFGGDEVRHKETARKRWKARHRPRERKERLFVCKGGLWLSQGHTHQAVAILYFCISIQSQIWEHQSPKILQPKPNHTCQSRRVVKGSKGQQCAWLWTLHILTGSPCLFGDFSFEIFHNQGVCAVAPEKESSTMSVSVVFAFKKSKWIPSDTVSLVQSLSGWIINPIPLRNGGLTAGSLNAAQCLAERLYSWRWRPQTAVSRVH